MKTVCLKPLYHRGQENIAIHAARLPDLNLAIRKLPGVKWSQTHKVWYLPLNETTYKQITVALKPLAGIDNHPLKQYLQKRKQVAAMHAVPESSEQRTRRPPAAPPARKLSPENLEALNCFVQKLGNVINRLMVLSGSYKLSCFEIIPFNIHADDIIVNLFIL